MTEARSSPRKIKALERRLVFLGHRREGRSFSEIARIEGVSKTRARQIVAEAMDGVEALTAEQAQALKRKLLRKYTRLLQSWWPRATGDGDVVAPDKDAAGVVLKGMAQMAKLAGLDAPQKVQQQVSHLDSLTDAELREEARRHGVPVGD